MNRFISIILGVLAIINFNCCKTHSSLQSHALEENYFKVEKITKLKNNVFVIYAKRNDTIFKILTHYDSAKRLSYPKTLKKGSFFKAELESYWDFLAKRFNLMYTLKIKYYNYYGNQVRIYEYKKKIWDLYFCDDINGNSIKETYELPKKQLVNKKNTVSH